MNKPTNSNRPLHRRTALKAAGIALALPWLESAKGNTDGGTISSDDKQQSPQRFFGICNNLGLLPEDFFPKQSGSDYELSPYLSVLGKHRQHFTVFSGVSHPNVDGGHPSDISFLTAAPHPASSSFRNSISLDQLIAEHIGHQTRFPSLTLSVNSGSRSLSWTGSGVAIPPEESAANLFKQLFMQGSSAEMEAQVNKLDSGRSILDTLAEQASELSRRSSNADRHQLDQYFSSVRDLESRLLAAKEWERKPKPVLNVASPTDPTNPSQYMTKIRLMYDMVKLAFQTDSTRSITLMLNSVGSPVIEIPGTVINDGYHNLSHHGKSAEKIAQLRSIDMEHMKLINQLLTDLKSTTEQGETLLERSMILYGSNLGDANAHSTTNMPILFAGGAFRHGKHLAFDLQQNYPLPNLFVSILQKMGIERDRFASSTGTMQGLEAL